MSVATKASSLFRRVRSKFGGDRHWKRNGKSAEGIQISDPQGVPAPKHVPAHSVTPGNQRRASIPATDQSQQVPARWGPDFNHDVLEEFYKTGYIVVDPEIPARILDEAAADTERMAEYTPQRHGTRVFDGWLESEAIYKIALAPKIMCGLEFLYGRKPKPFQTLNFPVGTQQRLHSDTIHFDCDPTTYMCGFWVALEDVDEENGPLIYYPGSHMLKKVTMEDVAPGPGREHYPAYEDYIEKLVAQSGLQPSYGILKKGQAIIWAANLVHGGSHQKDKQRTRMSQVTHFYFENCQYFTPMHSYGGFRYIRQPRWIV